MATDAPNHEVVNVVHRDKLARCRNRPCPQLLHHSSGQAYVRWKVNRERRTIYLGVWGSLAANAAYERFAASWPAPMFDTTPSRPRPDPRMLTHGEITQTLWAWARQLRLKPGTLAYRLKVLKWPLVKALFTPAIARGACPRLQRDEQTGKAFVRWRHRGKLLVRSFGAFEDAGTETAYREFCSRWEKDKV